jgi:outer membrane receptor protein involved in Fe transport
VTFGVVYTPNWAPSLSLSLDYFNIAVEDAIFAGIPAQTSLDNCLATGDPTFCSLITRNAANGGLLAGDTGVGFLQTNLNIGELETTGFDLQALYDFEMGRHSFRIDYAATILDKLDVIPFVGSAPIADGCSGKFGNECGTPNPEYRHRVVGTWVTPWSVDVNLTWRYFGETDNDDPAEQVEATLDAVNYVDVAATWYLLDDIEIRLSIINLLQEDPPIFSSAGPALGNGNTYPTVFDTSRVVVAGFQYNF